METATLGYTARTALAFVVLGTVAAGAALWQTLSLGYGASTLETLVLVTPFALFGVACAYFAAHG